MSGLTCRGCGVSDLQVVLSLGEMPPSNALLAQASLTEPERRYPLELAFCEACGLAQITVSIDPAELFDEYAYFSSYSTTMLAHAETVVGRMIAGEPSGPSLGQQNGGRAPAHPPLHFPVPDPCSAGPSGQARGATRDAPMRLTGTVKVGSTVRPQVALVTPAIDAYHAIAAVMMPR